MMYSFSKWTQLTLISLINVINLWYKIFNRVWINKTYILLSKIIIFNKDATIDLIEDDNLNADAYVKV